MTNEILGDRLRYLRTQSQRTQADIAKYLGITRAAYSHFENGRNEPSGSTLVKLANYFDVTTDYLLGNKVDDNLTVAAHMDENLTYEQKKDIQEFIEFQKAQYRKEHQDKKD